MVTDRIIVRWSSLWLMGTFVVRGRRAATFLAGSWILQTMNEQTHSLPNAVRTLSRAVEFKVWGVGLLLMFLAGIAASGPRPELNR